ncbi:MULTISPECIES: sulfate/molybdate ABC transporter ATP-binding protein [Vitreoscilla]|uniref:Sulfate ABC transporter ATP-binding protein n=1 Tax=Vitreoscilla stercoraria TaxID=61 RepID=A0ABY4E7K7_VITST|nr:MULTISPECIES: sulfate ABC transporter ATP-binding protein [Vitreoscilla]AUZ04559.1 sulfate ABC transporter ATP-binding protein [Vitreoscilla sp. C1]UOO91735.1 sulfate ABC transporter ATP-binding protein [Vitreoscilla stercoraria]
MSITIKNLNKHFGDFHALQNINLQVPTGALVSLLGPSGCGKTTLLRIIAGLETHNNGEIWFGDQNVSDKSVRERGVGFVFQNYALFRHMTVFDNVAFGLQVLPKNKRPSKDEMAERVHGLLKMVQLEWLAKSYPHQLSGGQRQRIALARALAVKPQLLLLDEPFGALDAKVRKELRQWLRDIHHEFNVTSLLVTHDQEEALEISDQIVVMNHGKVEQVGSGAHLYEQPDNAFVTEFLGEVNRFEGYIERGELVLGHFRYQAVPPQEKWSEGTATAYVRPHEFTISRDQTGSMLAAQIHHISVLGPIVRVSLYDATGQDIEVMIPHQQQLQHQYRVNETVFLTPTNISVFSQKSLVDYVI